MKLTTSLRFQLSQLNTGRIYAVQIQLIGMTRAIAGIMSATGKSFTRIMRNPVTKTISPPHAYSQLS